MSDEIGDLLTKSGEMECEWRISNFTSLPQELDKSYRSPKFYFANMCWCLQIYLNGQTETQSEGWVGIHLCRIDRGPPKSVTFSLDFKKHDGKRIVWKGERTFSQEKLRWGFSKFLELSYLLNRKSELAPLNILTVICTLESDAYQSTESSLFRRLWNLGLSFKNILTTQNGTDVVLKLNDGEVPAHRIILESRSAVFNRMFDVDMRETQTGEVIIEDGKKETFKVVLSYVYSGDPEGLCTENVYEVYKAAHKYDLEELVKLCVEFMQKSLTVDRVCDVIALAHVYQETTLKECANNYFVQHKTEVFKSAKWKKIKKENPALALELVEYVFGE